MPPPSRINSPKSPAGNTAVAALDEIRNFPLPFILSPMAAPKLWPVVTPRSRVLPLLSLRFPDALVLVVTVTVWLMDAPSPIKTRLLAVGVPAAGPPVKPVVDQVEFVSQFPFCLL